MSQPIDIEKVKEGDAALARARAINPDVRMPTLGELAVMTSARPTGRPPGPEPTATITIRMPVSLQVRLDAYLEKLEAQTGLKANRGTIARHALKLFLDAHEADAPEPAATQAPKRVRSRKPGTRR